MIGALFDVVVTLAAFGASFVLAGVGDTLMAAAKNSAEVSKQQADEGNPQNAGQLYDLSQVQFWRALVVYLIAVVVLVGAVLRLIEVVSG